MAESPKNPRSKDRHLQKGDRHANKGRYWNPDTEVFDTAMETLKRDLNWSMTGYLTESLRFLLGRRKTFPPRPAWAEERAAALPDDDPIRPTDATET